VPGRNGRAAHAAEACKLSQLPDARFAIIVAATRRFGADPLRG
jgi:hypothetical protein